MHAFVESEVTQSCPTLSDPMDCSPPGPLCPWDSPGKNTGVGCHALLQEIFPTPGWNPGLPHCRQILYCLSHQESPRYYVLNICYVLGTVLVLALVMKTCVMVQPLWGVDVLETEFSCQLLCQ